MGHCLRTAAVLLLLVEAASAQHYRFRHYGPEEGLSTAVSRLLQDRTGFLWVGTGNGLFRYDGARFQHFGTDDGLPSTSIRNLHETPDGTLWVVTGRGVARFRHHSFETVPIQGRRDWVDLHAIASSPDGLLYLGSDRGLLVGKASTPGDPGFHLLAGAPADPVNGILAEPDHTVWFSCGLRLCLMNHGGLRTFGEGDGLPPERWRAVMRSRDGTLWVRGAQHLLVMMPGADRFHGARFRPAASQ